LAFKEAQGPSFWEKHHHTGHFHGERLSKFVVRHKVLVLKTWKVWALLAVSVSRNAVPRVFTTKSSKNVHMIWAVMLKVVEGHILGCDYKILFQ
jgi:hypothetical protein